MKSKKTWRPWLTVADVAEIWTEEADRMRVVLGLKRRQPREEPIPRTTVWRYLTLSRPQPDGSTSPDERVFVDHPVPAPAQTVGLAPLWHPDQEAELRAWWRAHTTETAVRPHQFVNPQRLAERQAQVVGAWAELDALLAAAPERGRLLTAEDVARIWTEERDDALRVAGKPPKDTPIQPRTVYNYLHLSQPAEDGSTEGRRYAAAGWPVPAPVQRVGGGRAGGYPVWRPEQEQELRQWWNGRAGHGRAEYGQA